MTYTIRASSTTRSFQRVGPAAIVLTLSIMLPTCAQERELQQPAGVGRTGPALRTVPDSPWMEFHGKPVLLIGDSITQGWMELGANFDQQAYLDALARRGINALLLWSYIGITDQVSDRRIGYDAPEIWPWATEPSAAGERQFNLLVFNDEYFRRLRRLVETAAQKNVVVIITIHDGWTKTRFDGHPLQNRLGGYLNDKRDYVRLARYGEEMPAGFDINWTSLQKHQFVLERFCDRLLQATGDQGNVIYEMFNEGEWYDRTQWSDFQRHFLQFFRSRTEQPLMVNDDRADGKEFRSDPMTEIVARHLPQWRVETTAREFFERHARHFESEPVKPCLMSETVPEYAGGAEWHAAIVRMLWGTALSGTSIVLQNDTSWGFDPRTSMAQYAADRDIVLDLEGHLARFFNSEEVGFALMRPDGALTSTGVCLANRGSEYVVYVPSEQRDVTMDLTDVEQAYYDVRWYDPYTGRWQPAEAIQGGAVARISAPWQKDAVVHLKRRQ